jgi:hypothetical protein
MKSSVLLVAICLGFVLLASSFLWTTLFSAKSSWTPEKAERWSQVKSRLYDLGFLMNTKVRMHAGPDPATLRTEYEELEKENQLLAAEFSSVSSRPHKIANLLKWSGIALAVVGIIGWYAVKES